MDFRLIAAEVARNTPAPLIMLTGYFDESGKLDDSEIVSFGGCYGVHASTEKLNDGWRQRLGQDGLSHVSMKEAINFQGPFRKWWKAEEGLRKRDAVLCDLASLIISSGMLIASCPVQASTFKQMPKALRDKYWNDPQYASFEACISGALHLTANTFLHITCDLSEEYPGKLVTLFNKLRNRDPLAKARCFAVTFADDERHGGLQAADMIAYCSRAEYTKAEPDPIVKTLIGIFTTPDRKIGQMSWDADGEGLGGGQLSGL